MLIFMYTNSHMHTQTYTCLYIHLYASKRTYNNHSRIYLWNNINIQVHNNVEM